MFPQGKKPHLTVGRCFLKRCFFCQDSKVEASAEFHQTCQIQAGILDLLSTACCCSLSRKCTRWWLFLRLLWGSDETCGVTVWECWDVRILWNLVKLLVAWNSKPRKNWCPCSSICFEMSLTRLTVCCTGRIFISTAWLMCLFPPTLLLFFPFSQIRYCHGLSTVCFPGHFRIFMLKSVIRSQTDSVILATRGRLHSSTLAS